MSEVILYHNPRCSKSRQTLALLGEHNITPEVKDYLKEGLYPAEIRTLLTQLNIAAHDILRPKEAEYKEAALHKESPEDDIIAALVAYPKLLERPIVVKGNKAIIGRPPENILTLIKR